MTDCVIDANVVIKWFVRQADTDRALASIERFDFMAPDIILAEVANGLWKYVRADVLDHTLAQAILTGLEDNWFFTEPVDENLAGEALDIAVHTDHPVYDCLYVALARRHDIPFLTADRRLVRRFQMFDLARIIDLQAIDPENASNEE